MIKISPQTLFGTAEQDFREFDLNQVYLWYRKEIPDPRKPEQIQSVLRKLDSDYRVFGGYGENRKDVWAKTYMRANKKFIHLGVDVNMPYGTSVYSPFDAEVVNVLKDRDREIGWGGRLILKRGNKFLVLGHLDPKTMTTAKTVKQGDLLGMVGTWPTNGNTFEHLHVQIVTNPDFSNLDGYGYESDLPNNPNPFDVEF